MRSRAAGRHEQAEGLCGGVEVELGGDDLEELGHAGLGVLEELGPRAARREVDLGALASDLEDQLGGLRVDVGPRVVHPPANGLRALLRDADAALLHVLDAEDDFLAAALLVEADVVGDEALLQPLEVKVSRVPQQLLAVDVVANMDGISAQQLDQLGESIGAAVRNRGREDGRRTDEALALEAREEVVAAGEEGGKAEGEEVGRVARVFEDVAGDLELAVADGDEDAFFVELRDELGYCNRINQSVFQLVNWTCLVDGAFIQL